MTRRQQRAEALARANAVRFARARLRRELAADRDRDLIVQILRDPAVADGVVEPGPPGWVGGMSVARMVESCWRVGPVATSKLLRRAGITRGPKAVLSELTDRERNALAAEIEMKGT